LDFGIKLSFIIIIVTFTVFRNSEHNAMKWNDEWWSEEVMHYYHHWCVIKMIHKCEKRVYQFLFFLDDMQQPCTCDAHYEHQSTAHHGFLQCFQNVCCQMKLATERAF